MERDFLGAIGRRVEEEESEAKDGMTGSDYLGGAPAMQWQFPAKAGAAPAFMSFRPAREGDSKEAGFDHFSFSGFRQPPASPSAGDAFDGIKKQAFPVMPHQQRQFGFDGHDSTQQYAAAAVHGHRAQGMDSYGVAAHHLLGGSRPFRHPVPFSLGSPMLRVQSLPSAAGGGPFKNQCFAMSNAVASSTVGVYGPRDLQNPKSTQMTIFYNGSVNVFDVPVEKAQELMLLASRASILSPPRAASRSDSPISATAKFAVAEVLPARQIVIQKPKLSVPHVSGISSPVPAVLQTVTLSKSTSSSNNDTERSKSMGVPSVVPPISQASSSQPMPQATPAAAAIMPRAVPQARKASLSRFLEKRKERVSSAVPYPSSKSPLESSDTLGSASTPSKSSCADMAPLSHSGEKSISLGQPRNISFGSEKFPSTKLQI